MGDVPEAFLGGPSYRFLFFRETILVLRARPRHLAFFIHEKVQLGVLYQRNS